MGIRIDVDKCTGCGSCLSVCPFGIIELVDDKAQIGEGCNLCGACKDAWTKLIETQLDFRTRPCNLVELMPRLRET